LYRKLLFIGIAALMLMAMLLPGCVSQSAAPSQAPTTAPAAAGTDEPPAAKKLEYAKFTVYNGDATDTTQVDPMTTDIWPNLFEITNTDLEVEFLVGQDGDQKAGLMIASGEMPDIIIPFNSWRTFDQAGVFLDLTPYLDQYAPDLVSYVGEDGIKLSTNEDGKFYSVTRDMPQDPNAQSKSQYPISGAFYICNGALKEAGYPVVKTWDQYVQLIADYVAKHPTTNGMPTIGFSGPSEGWRWVFTENGANKLSGVLDDLFVIDQQTGHVKEFYGETVRAKYKDYFKKLFDLNQAGLLDPELVSQTYDQYVAKLSSGRVVAYQDEWWESGLPARANWRANSMADAYQVPMPVLGPGVAKDTSNGSTNAGYWPKACISTSCKNPERAVQFFNAMANETVAKLINWGVEGTHYVIKDGNNDLTDEQDAFINDPDKLAKSGIRCSTLGTLMPLTYPLRAKYSDGTDWDYYTSDARFKRAYDDTEKGILAQYGWADFASGAFAPQRTTYSATLEDPPAVADFWTAWYGPSSPTTYYQKMMYAKDEAEFEHFWSEWITLLDSMDVQPVIDTMNARQDMIIAQYGIEAVRVN
jgi:putative aldouronate transport system substrate-binding protein